MISLFRKKVSQFPLPVCWRLPPASTAMNCHESVHRQLWANAPDLVAEGWRGSRSSHLLSPISFGNDNLTHLPPPIIMQYQGERNLSRLTYGIIETPSNSSPPVNPFSSPSATASHDATCQMIQQIFTQEDTHF